MLCSLLRRGFEGTMIGRVDPFQFKANTERFFVSTEAVLGNCLDVRSVWPAGVR